jgi:hypothetical protein
VTQFRDDATGGYRCTARIVYDPLREHVYIEIESKHDDTIVCNSVRVDRATFAHRLRELGAL